MITDHVISIKWATAINTFDIKEYEDLALLNQFRSWYTKASSIDEVPEPFKGWVLNGLPDKHKKRKEIEGVTNA